MKVAHNEAWHIYILCAELSVLYGLWQFHLVIIWINKL